MTAPARAPETYDAVVIGGGPSGATAAHELAKRGRTVLLLDKAGRVKPCGGAVPPQLLVDFDVPRSLLVAEIASARMVSPRGRAVDIPVGDGFVGMVDRGRFDEWLRERAAGFGAVRACGFYDRIERDADGTAVVCYREGGSRSGEERRVRARFVVGADGALSAVARQEVKGGGRPRHVFAYHEIIEAPAGEARYDATRCDVYYQGRLSPDFYAWIFPHGDHCSVGHRLDGAGLRHARRRGDAPRGHRARRREDAQARGRADPARAAQAVGQRPRRGARRRRRRRGGAVVGRGDLLRHDRRPARRRGGGAGHPHDDARALRTARRQFMREHGPCSACST
jgi:geranylgeranyl reductase